MAKIGSFKAKKAKVKKVRTATKVRTKTTQKRRRKF